MIIRSFVLFAWVLITSGCSNVPYFEEPIEYLGGSEQTIRSSDVESKASKQFFQAESWYRAKQYSKAAKLYSSIQRKFPRGKANMYSTYRLGTIFYYQGKYPQASEEFNDFIAKYPQSDLRPDVLYNFAAAEYQQENYERAYRLILKLPKDEVYAMGAQRTQMVYQLARKAAIKAERPSLAIRATDRQLNGPPLPAAQKNHLLRQIGSQLEEITESESLDKLTKKVAVADVRKLIENRRAILESNHSLASQSEYIGLSQDHNRDTVVNNVLKSSSSGERSHIGVVLPLTGRWGNYGKKALDAILLASKVFSSQVKTPFKLFIRDSASNPINAQNAVDDLVRRNNVYAIIGSISWKESLAVARRAQKLGVVNLSLTFKEGLSSRGAYIFQNALTPRVQLESLVKYCVEEKDYKRFAILSPNDSFGKDLSNHFWNLVEQFGAKVVAYETYDPKGQDFQQPIRKLTGVDNLKFRKYEAEKMAEFVEIKKEEGGRLPKIEVPPVIDYDALFIPDNPRRVGQIAPALAFFDVTGVPLLGTIEWNSDQLYKRGGKYVEGAVFPGGINLATSKSTQREFINLYLDAYGTAPELLAAQAYEATTILMAAIRKTSSSDRNDLVNQMFTLQNFETPLGKISFDQNRLAQRKLSVNILGYGGKIQEN